MPEDSWPVDFFRAIVNDSLGLLQPHSLQAKWEPVTTPEIDGFLAIILNMGLSELPHIQDYWTMSWISEVPFFGKMMSRERFTLIFWLLIAMPLSFLPVTTDNTVLSLIPLLENVQSSMETLWIGT